MENTRSVKQRCKYDPLTLQPTDRRSQLRSCVTFYAISDFQPENRRHSRSMERRATGRATAGIRRYPRVSAFVRAVWRKPVWGWFSGRAVRRGRGERGAIVFCVMYNSPSSLGSRVGSSGPPSVPVISVAVARGTIYPTPHCHDILETFLSLPRFSFPHCARLSLS